jgi:hypothetical protein
MQKLIALFVVVFLCVATLPALGSIFANPQVNNIVWLSTENVGGNSGGPFTGHLGLSYPNSGATWDTFCVEADGSLEYFAPNTNYTVLNTSANTATGTGNYVTNAAKWLYWMYGTNQLANYTNSYNDKTSLQEAIWHGVLGGGINGSSLNMTFDTTAQTWFAAAVTATGETWSGNKLTLEGTTWADADLVRVMNPGYYSGITEAQSQLYAIPEPASLIVWSLFMAGGSWLGMRVWRRR